MKAYAIKDPNGKILRRSVRGFKKDSIKTVTGIFFEWEFQYRKGYRCVPVEIREINKEKV